MRNSIDAALKEAYRERAQGRTAQAEQAYCRAAELARAEAEPLALAHALRHISDLARGRGASAEAFSHASEAAALYRFSDDRLGLANAIRLQALSVGNPDGAKAYWREARDLYSSLDVSAGVSECNGYLDD